MLSSGVKNSVSEGDFDIVPDNVASPVELLLSRGRGVPRYGREHGETHGKGDRHRNLIATIR